MQKRNFHIGAVLAITCNKIIARIQEIQELVEFLLQQPVPHHQLADSMASCKAEILSQYPSLEKIVVPEGLDSFEKITIYLKNLLHENNEVTEFLTLQPMAIPEKLKDPVSSLVEQIGSNRVIVVGAKK